MPNGYERFELAEPELAPPWLLANVHVGFMGACLESESKVGPISLELRWRKNKYHDTDEEKLAEFYEPETPAPGCASDSKEYPYIVLPPNVFYRVFLHVPTAAVNQEWSKEYEQPLASGSGEKLIDPAEVQGWFPGLETDLLPGKYEVTAMAQSRLSLGVLIRNSVRGPLVREQPNTSIGYYLEGVTYMFRECVDRPGVATIGYDAYETRIKGGAQTLYEPLCVEDGSQSGGMNHSLEVIILQTSDLLTSEISFYFPEQHSRGPVLRRYKMHEKSTMSISALPITAFRFALRASEDG